MCSEKTSREPQSFLTDLVHMIGAKCEGGGWCGRGDSEQDGRRGAVAHEGVAESFFVVGERERVRRGNVRRRNAAFAVPVVLWVPNFGQARPAIL